jgi:hypothetical protein
MFVVAGVDRPDDTGQPHAAQARERASVGRARLRRLEAQFARRSRHVCMSLTPKTSLSLSLSLSLSHTHTCITHNTTSAPPNLRVIVLPSLDDVDAHLSFPQPPLPAFGLVPNYIFVFVLVLFGVVLFVLYVLLCLFCW